MPFPGDLQLLGECGSDQSPKYASHTIHRTSDFTKVSLVNPSLDLLVDFGTKDDLGIFLLKNFDFLAKNFSMANFRGSMCVNGANLLHLKLLDCDHASTSH